MAQLVSIIIPTYKRASALPQAISSVKAQTYSNWELLIVDDNHPESVERLETERVMAGFTDDANIRYIQHEKNLGACTARNTGLDHASGIYVAYLDDDDLWHQEKLKKQVNALLASQVSFCYSDMELSYQGRIKYFSCVPDKNLYLRLLNQGFGICTSALLIKREALNAIGGFDDSLPSMQDYDLLLRLSKAFDAVHIPEALLIYQLAEDGISCNPDSKVKGHQGIINKYQAEYLSLGLHKGLSRQFESLGDFQLRSSQRIKAISSYWKGLCLSPLNPRLLCKLLIGGLCGKKPLESYLQYRQDKSSKKVSE
ncbi:glycosyltransferase family 2 protein [Pseudoalteromonas ulvae]|uniref:Glycosyl transferase family 2 n=1 Tax=Pseudoalteromonas ulvae TaxID=107327 RepID=A0A244CQ73_PSEDV|nr:glycosyltransferase [Pseudoalteromonas ulvae]OUL57646.1 glycosyl transferase family 2 [Pseudoalteromonas ulvae]